jgi:hypothetical protein
VSIAKGVWTGRGRAVPRIVRRKGSVVRREVVENVPMGWEGETKVSGTNGTVKGPASR